MLKDQLELLNKEINSLKEKITQKLAENKKALNESNHKLELISKENSENEKVLEQLGKEMEELGRELE
jgi:hypothetical protein